MGEVDAPDNVHLPQLHRPAPLAALVVGTATAPLGRLDQPVADQGPVHRGAPRQRVDALPSQTVEDRARPPARMGPAQLDDGGLDLRWHLVRTGLGLGRAVGQTGQTMGRVAAQPVVHRLAGHAVAPRHVDHGGPVEHFTDRLVTLLHQPQLHQHDDGLLRICGRGRPQRRRRRAAAGGPSAGGDCRAGTGASVAQVPEPRPESVRQVPEPRCQV